MPSLHLPLVARTALFAQELPIPDSPGEGVILALFVALMISLWLVVRRTRQQSERHYRERRRKEQQRLPEPDDPTELP